MKTKLYTTILLLLALCLPTGAFGQAQIANYVRTKTMTAANGSTYLDQIDYIGPDGKKYHTVYKGITPSGKNLLTYRAFNNLGKEIGNWLPIEYGSDYASSYLFKVQGSGYYNNDTRPFHETVYESSAVGRVTAEYGPGQAWANNPVRYDYGTNTSSGVLSLIRYTVGSNYALTANGTVPAGTLNVTKVTDEDGHEAYSFTDQLGRTLLERRLNGNEQLDTYYVYDSYGRLCYVLQPMYQSEADLSKYAYRYEYDSRGRCTKKTLPGTEYVLYEYDENDRVIFSQDGNQRAAGKWQCYRYDDSGRLLNRLESTTKSNVISSGDITNHYDYHLFFSGSSYSGIPAWDDAYIETVSDFSDKGQLTGSEVKVIGSNTTIRTVYYYNPDGLLRKQVENNLLGGFDTYEYTYTFTKQPATMTHTHTASGKPTITEVLTYTYDHGERLTKVTHKLNNGTAVPIAEYTYDKYGRVASKTMHGNTTSNKVDYAYNIRGWVTDVVYPYFRQHLTYNNGTTGFNGNITSMIWRTENNAEMIYNFTYDGANRMLDAIYSESYSMNQNVDRYTEKVTEYDKNGNIKKLQRYGQTGASSYGLVDNLTYTYNGNKLTRVDDAVTATSYTGGTNFINGASTSNEYVYDQNGNITKDLNKGISNIQYNSLNLPSVVTFSDGSTITYTYTHDGKKLRTVHVIGGVTTTTDYCGNVIYENGTAKRLLTDEGYVDLTNNTYYYYLKDHQGNNRAVVNSSGTVQETNHYYPFGGLFATNGSVQDYKYNGKELDDKTKWYDYGARHYDAALGRWHVVDPMGDKHYNLSPYNYCLNNPLKFIDPNGEDAVVVVDGNNVTIKANVILTGPLANEQLAKIYQDDIMSNWGSITSYEHKGKNYNLIWDVNVRVATEGEKEDFNGMNNYMEVVSENSKVYESSYGLIRNVGRYGLPLEYDNPMSHEFGHILGLKDKYKKIGENKFQPVSTYWRGNVMAEEAGFGLVEKKNLDIFLPKAIDTYNNFESLYKDLLWEDFISYYYKYQINKDNRE